MIYLLKHAADLVSTASAETDERAAALERAGYRRCTVAAWRQARRANDLKDVERLALEDWLERQNTPVETAPLMAKVRG